MIKHREAYEALKTIANYCYGRDCETECIFFNGKDKGNVCRLTNYKFSPAYYEIDPDEVKPIEERMCEAFHIAQLEAIEKQCKEKE